MSVAGFVVLTVAKASRAQQPYGTCQENKGVGSIGRRSVAEASLPLDRGGVMSPAPERNVVLRGKNICSCQGSLKVPS